MRFTVVISVIRMASSRGSGVTDMRFTVVDEAGSISFVGPGHAMKMLAAGCAKEPADFWELMEAVGRYDGVFARTVLDGVRIFDEHNTPDDHSEMVTRLEESDSREDPPIRVLDELTRRRRTGRYRGSSSESEDSCFHDKRCSRFAIATAATREWTPILDKMLSI